MPDGARKGPLIEYFPPSHGDALLGIEIGPGYDVLLLRHGDDVERMHYPKGLVWEVGPNDFGGVSVRYHADGHFIGLSELDPAKTSAIARVIQDGTTVWEHPDVHQYVAPKAGVGTSE